MVFSVRQTTSTGATHEPHQVPKSWIAKYQGEFDAGWDRLREENFARQKQLGVIPANAKLTPHPEGLPVWDSLSVEEKKLVAHEAEVYAAYAAQADYDVGRVLQAVDDEGKKENTVVVWIFGDNGASAEGGPTGRDAIDIAGNPKSVSRVGPSLDGHAYTIDADVDIPAPGTTGVIFSRGGRYGGSSLFVKNNRVTYEVNAFGSRAGQMIGSDPLPTGRVHVRVEITPANGGQHANAATDGARTVLPGTGKLFVNGKQTAEGSFLNLHGTGTGVDIGSNLGSEVSSEYHAPNNFTGEIEQVTIRVR
jgi:arylsulfatase A-like enzyme